MTSIRARLLASLLGTLTLAAIVLGLFSYRSTLAEVESLFDYQLRQMALTLRDQGEIAPEQARTLADQDTDFVVQIWSADGRAIYATRAHDSLPARAVLGFADIATGDQAWRTYSVADQGRVIQVAQPLSIRRRLAANAALSSVLPLLVLAPLLALLMGWLVTRTLAPLRDAARQVQARDAESLAALPADGMPDEVTPLLAALNGLLQRLGAAFDAQRGFVADAAHELRSPLTALKLQIGLLRRATDDTERGTAIEALAAGIERATRLVEQLLTLARSEPGAVPVPHERVDLGALVLEALADSVPQAAARGSTLELDAEPGLEVLGDRSGLVALARNLADNALRYSPPGASVKVSVRAVADGPQPDAGGRPSATLPELRGEAATIRDGVLLRVDDDGPGIPPADRERVFDRFVRRTGADAPGGSGLGLAIVKSVVERHAGRVMLGTSPAGGLRVDVLLPAAAAARPGT